MLKYTRTLHKSQENIWYSYHLTCICKESLFYSISDSYMPILDSQFLEVDQGRIFFTSPYFKGPSWLYLALGSLTAKNLRTILPYLSFFAYFWLFSRLRCDVYTARTVKIVFKFSSGFVLKLSINLSWFLIFSCCRSILFLRCFLLKTILRWLSLTKLLGV